MTIERKAKRVLLMGAAGRDFHNFNVVFRDDAACEVVAFTATLDDPAAVAGKRVIVVDDGPTITHGGMAYGAGYVAAVQARVAEIVDPRASAVGDIAEVFPQYPHIGKVLPAHGVFGRELAELRRPSMARTPTP